MRAGRMTSVVLLAGAGILALGACSSPPPYAGLATSQRAVDVVPTTTPKSDGLQADSSRFVGTRNGVDYYLVRSQGELGEGICIVMSPRAEPGQGMTGCGGGEGTGLKVSAHDIGSARYVSKDEPVPSGWTRLSADLIISD